MNIHATRLSLLAVQCRMTALTAFKTKLNSKYICSPYNYCMQYDYSSLERDIKLKFRN